MGCIARIGCLLFLAVLGAAGWFTRGYWMPKVFGDKAASASVAWQPLTPAGAERTQVALDQLARKDGGPVFKTLPASDVAAYILKNLANQMPKSTDSVTAAVIGDRMHLRASLRPADIGGASALGAMGALMGDRERVELSGTLRVVKPGLAEFTVESARIGNFSVPRAVVPRVVRAIVKRARPAGVSERGLPVVIPPSIGDVRVSNGKITIYKTGS